MLIYTYFILTLNSEENKELTSVASESKLLWSDFTIHKKIFDIIDFETYQPIQNIAQQRRPSRPIIDLHAVYWIPWRAQLLQGK